MSALQTIPEAVLHYAWQHQRFDQANLHTSCGLPVQIIDRGTYNLNAGPDFLQARIRLGEKLLAGHIELHVKAQDWVAHQHQHDPAYNAVILHVCLENPKQKPIYRADGTLLPELLMKDRLDPGLMTQYRYIQQSGQDFPCAGRVATVHPFKREQWVYLLGWERMNDKVTALEADLNRLQYNWEALIWEKLAEALGGKVNKLSFRELAARVPVKWLRWVQQDLFRLEAMLFGASGLLQPALQNAPNEPYVQQLQQEWNHLQQKYSVRQQAPIEFRFARLRPANFPSLRIAQLAAFVHTFPDLMQFVSSPETLQIKEKAIHPSTYWLSHYRFGKASNHKPKPIGKTFLNNLLINAFIPLAMLFRQTLQQQEAIQQLLDLMEKLPAEKNRIVSRYRKAGFKPGSALDTQGLLHLHKNYCSALRCLECGIGHQLLKHNSLQPPPGTDSE